MKKKLVTRNEGIETYFLVEDGEMKKYLSRVERRAMRSVPKEILGATLLHHRNECLVSGKILIFANRMWKYHKSDCMKKLVRVLNHESLHFAIGEIGEFYEYETERVVCLLNGDDI